MKWENNEVILMDYLVNKKNIGKEMTPLSIRSIDDLELVKIKIIRRPELYKPVMESKAKWFMRLRNKGYIEVDYTKKFQPKICVTEKGLELLKK